MPLVPYTADISTIHRLDTDNAIEEIQHCINQLRMDEPLLATEYICIDDQLPIERFTDDDIIATVQNEEEYEMTVITSTSPSLKSSVVIHPVVSSSTGRPYLFCVY